MAILKLINKYFIRSIVGPICLFGVPLFFCVLFFVIGKIQFSTAFPIICTVGILSSSLMIIPTLIIELKKSLILKRIGAAKISKYEFLLILFVYFLIINLIAITYAFVLYSIFSAIEPGTEYSWKNPKIGNVIYSSLVLSILSILISIIIGSNINNSMIASAISFLIIFFSLFTSGLLMPITSVRNVFGLEIIGYIIPTDWPILQMQESWGVGSFVYDPVIKEKIYWIVTDSIWDIHFDFNVYTYIDLDLNNPEPKLTTIIGKFAKGWNIFSPYFVMCMCTVIIPITFKWTER